MVYKLKINSEAVHASLPVILWSLFCNEERKEAQLCPTEDVQGDVKYWMATGVDQEKLERSKHNQNLFLIHTALFLL